MGARIQDRHFQVEQLFDPKRISKPFVVLRRAFDPLQNESEPLPFALAEYNAEQAGPAVGLKPVEPRPQFLGSNRFSHYAQIRSIDS